MMEKAIQEEVGKILHQYGNTEMGQYKLQLLFEDLSKPKWIKYREQKPPMGIEVLAYHPDWVSEDFNPTGTRIGFQDLSDGDDGDFVSAHYWSDQDCYMTISHGECTDNPAFSEEIKESIAPELWASLEQLTNYLPKQ